MSKQKILIIATAPLHNGPRMIREIEALKPYYTIFTVGGTPPHDPTLPYYPAQKLHNSFIDRALRKIYKTVKSTYSLKTLFFTEKRIHKLLKEIKPDIIIAHDPSDIPYLLSYPDKHYKIIYNAHEYHPLEFDEDEKWLKLWGNYYYQLYKEILPKIDLLINVCESIAVKCREEFGKNSIVIPNAALYFPDLYPVKNNNGPIRLIHHGIGNRTRKIEIMIEVAQILGDNYQLDLMLVPIDETYYKELQTLAQKAGNVFLIKPVAFNEIVPFINKYDVGLYNLPPKSFNNKIALPNKFFEFIQARLCIVVSPSIEMRRIVEEYELGLVSEDFTAVSISNTIKKITRNDINQYKYNSHKAAYPLSAQHYQAKLLEAIQTL